MLKEMDPYKAKALQMRFKQVANPHANLSVPETWENVQSFSDWWMDNNMPIQFPLFPEVFLSDAVKILFLCAHEPEVWDHLRANHLAIVKLSEAWANDHIPRQMQTEAIGLALKILELATVTEAIPEPSTRQDSNAGK
jgi:hypothetical protein